MKFDMNENVVKRNNRFFILKNRRFFFGKFTK